MEQEIKVGRVRTSRTELVDISKAWVALSLAFAFLLFPRFYGTGITLLGGFSFAKVLSFDFFVLFVISLFTAGLGFLFHELAHKIVAQKYGCGAEFRAWDQFLYLAVGLAVVIGFIFAAPGAVMISGMITRKENGIVSAAGPATNYILGFIFFALTFIYPIWDLIWLTGLSVNMWLGLFNLIPFGPLDGAKVFHWNKVVWGIMAAVGILFVFFLEKVITVLGLG